MAKDAFAIMPFSGTATCTEAQWTEIYENVFVPAIEGCGYTCERAKPMTGSLSGSIIDRLRSARIVLADLTDRNPNVFYELGIRHSLRKGTILVAQGSHHIPSDLKGYWFVNYSTTPQGVTTFKGDVKRLVAAVDADPDKSDNPVADYLDKEHISIQGHMRRDAIKKLGALGTELSGLRNTLTDLVRSPELARFVSCDCLKLLCQTMYIDVGPELLRQAYELVYSLKRVTYAPPSNALLAETHSQLNALATQIHSVREMLLRGEYIEPTVVSTMEWVGIGDRLDALLDMGLVRPAQRCAFSPKGAIQRVYRPTELAQPVIAAARHEACHVVAANATFTSPLAWAAEAESVRSKAAQAVAGKPGRNKPCSCGSGRKFKNCCGRNQ